VQGKTSLWDNLVLSCSCPLSRLCRPAAIDRPLGIRARDWTAVELMLCEFQNKIVR